MGSRGGSRRPIKSGDASFTPRAPRGLAGDGFAKTSVAEIGWYTLERLPRLLHRSAILSFTGVTANFASSRPPSPPSSPRAPLAVGSGRVDETGLSFFIPQMLFADDVNAQRAGAPRSEFRADKDARSCIFLALGARSLSSRYVNGNASRAVLQFSGSSSTCSAATLLHARSPEGRTGASERVASSACRERRLARRSPAGGFYVRNVSAGLLIAKQLALPIGPACRYRNTHERRRFRARKMYFLCKRGSKGSPGLVRHLSKPERGF